MSTTMVLLPSLTFPVRELRKIVGIQHYEERMLCWLLELADPGIVIVYVSSVHIDPAIVDYYLGFLDDPIDARRRLHLVSLDDAVPGPLSEKLLERPEVLAHIRSLVSTAPRSFIWPFNVTSLEAEVARIIETPIYGPHPDLIPLGSKSGSRNIAREAGVPVLRGAEDLTSVEEVESALFGLKGVLPAGASAVIKLNNGFSGQGNAIVDLDDLTAPLGGSRIIYCASEESWASFEESVIREGAVVEELVRSPGVLSPSVQMKITQDHQLEMLSTHDQILGGLEDQVYLGCRFPAGRPYRISIQEHARRIGEALAKRGVIGPFGIDFIVVPAGAERRIYVSEINLRMGGTSHPFYMASRVTDGRYDVGSGDLLAGGRAKFYVATDNLKSSNLIGLSASEAIGALDRRALGYNRTSYTGVLLHLLGALEKYGKVGATCIGDSTEEADALYAEVVRALEDAMI
ncbi:MAG: peptide ligase PGM1-related protein [Actinomycetota bacterium]|nr:peptide ligase PGM1-related protein [Actinomycetota bacterium]